MKNERIDMTVLKADDYCQFCELSKNRKLCNSSLLLKCCECSEAKFHPFCLAESIKNKTAFACQKCSSPLYYKTEKKNALELLTIPHVCWISKKDRFPFLYPLMIPPIVIAILCASVYSQQLLWHKLLENGKNTPVSVYFFGALVTYFSLSFELALAYLFTKWFLSSFSVWVEENPAIEVYDFENKMFIPRVYYPDDNSLLWFFRKLFYPSTYEAYLRKKGCTTRPTEVAVIHPMRSPVRKNQETSPELHVASPCPSTDSSDEFADMEFARSGTEFALTSTPYLNSDRKLSQKNDSVRFNMSAIQEDDEESEELSAVVPQCFKTD